MNLWLEKTLAALLLVLTIGTSAALFLHEQPINVRAFRDACRLSGYSCRGITAPRVMRAAVPLAPTWYGIYYPGSSVVFVRDDVNVEIDSGYIVLVHEMVHYLQLTVGGLVYVDQFTGCIGEAEAFAASNRLARELGNPELARDNWAEQYGCPLEVTNESAR